MPLSSRLLSATSLLLIASFAQAAIPEMAKVVRAEALRDPQDPTGKPLPLVAHWHRDSLPLSFQLQMIREGVPVLPWINYFRTMAASRVVDQANEIRTLREWGLPFSLLTGGQWEADFYKSPEYKTLPIEQTGVGMKLDGSRMAQVSPMSPVEPWHALGQKWTDNAAAKAIQSLYPDPPLVFFISNNEANEIKPGELEKDKRYVDLYGINMTDEFKRQLAGDLYVDRYTALFDGMRAGLSEKSWKTNSKIIAYNAFGPDKWGAGGAFGGSPYSTSTRITHNWHMWEGSVSEAYDNDWEPAKLAFFLWSMQVELMNFDFMKQEAYAVNPNFWFELITWDGYTWRDTTKKKAENYAAAGVNYTPELYEGWTQYALWLLTPRVLREWRASSDDKENWWSYFQGLINAVVAVHQDPVLKRFWRHGTLVPNTSRPHPFNAKIPEKWANVERWFHQSTNLDPDLSSQPKYLEGWKDNPSYRFKVFTLARTIGEAPNREWLVYAHAPLGEQQDVAVTIPGYREVILPMVAIAGTFYHITESEHTVAPLPKTKIPAPTLRIR